MPCLQSFIADSFSFSLSLRKLTSFLLVYFNDTCMFLHVCSPPFCCAVCFDLGYQAFTWLYELCGVRTRDSQLREQYVRIPGNPLIATDNLKVLFVSLVTKFQSNYLSPELSVTSIVQYYWCNIHLMSVDKSRDNQMERMCV